MTRHKLRIKRVYQPPQPEDGAGILVDRLWPRGLSRERTRVDLWLKEIAASATLRRRFHGAPGGWEEFRTAYYAELEEPAAQTAVRSCSINSGASPSRCFLPHGTRPAIMQSH